MSELAIEATGLSKRFGDVVAVDQLQLGVEHGAVFGLVGRNGAGKTTALRMLAGLLRPSAGSARVLGADLWTAPRSLRAEVAYVSQYQRLHGWMTADELCRYLSFLYERWDDGYARTLARRWEVPGQRPVGLLSGGEQRRVALLLALAARPRVLVLDEPAAGLDPVARRQLIEALVETISSRADTTVLLSTHILGDLERIATTVGFVDRGKMLMVGAIDDIQATTKRVQIVFDAGRVPAGFLVPGALRTRTSGAAMMAVVKVADERELRALHDIPGARVELFPIGLEDIFIELVGPTEQESGNTEARQ